MSSHEQPQAKVNGVHRARVATGRPLSEKATEPFKPATPATPLGPTTAPSQDAPPAAGPAAPRRAVRVVQSSADAGTKHRPWVYVKHALMHPWHVVVLAGATVFGVANYNFNLVGGFQDENGNYFTSTLVFRESSNQFEGSP